LQDADSGIFQTLQTYQFQGLGQGDVYVLDASECWEFLVRLPGQYCIP
jgi:hypothetical protein